MLSSQSQPTLGGEPASANTGNPWGVLAALSQLAPANFNNPAESQAPRDATMPSDDLTDAKIAKSQAETETKIVRMEGKIDTAFAALGGKLDTVNQRLADQTKDRNLVIGTIVVSAISVAVLIIGLATYGDALFGRGMNVRDVVQSVMKEQQQIQVQPLPSTQPKH